MHEDAKSPTILQIAANELREFASGLREGANEELEQGEDDAQEVADMLVEEANELEALAVLVAGNQLDAARKSFGEFDSDLSERVDAFAPAAYSLLHSNVIEAR